VYGGCKVNIGAIHDPKHIASIIFLAAKDPEDPVVKDPNKLWALAQQVGQAQSFGVYFDDLKAFSDYVKDPSGALMGLLSDPQRQDANSSLNPQDIVPVEGVELDRKKLSQVARSGPRRTYRIEVSAKFGNLTRRLTAVWDTQVQRQNARGTDRAHGAWVLWRYE